MQFRVAVLSPLFGVALAGCNRAKPAIDTPPPLVDVTAANTVTADSGLVESGPALSGTLAAQRTVQLRAQLAGTILLLPVEEGSNVTAGQIVAVMDTASVAEAARSAKSQLGSMQLAAQVAHRNDERSRNLHDAGAIADRDLEVAHNQAVASDAAVADAKSRLTTAEKALSNAVVHAPFSGVVSTRPAHVGDVLQLGNPILTIVDPEDLEVDGSVGADALVSIKRGAKVQFSVNGNPGHIFTGEVARINPAVDSVTRQVKLYISVPNHEHSLAAGLFAQGRIAVQSVHGLAIPTAALDPKASSPTVHRLKGGKVELVPVTVGVRDDLAERIQVTGGLALGDTLLIGAALSTPATASVRITQADH
jgi:membrane fusion protein (multidrug efflux system)